MAGVGGTFLYNVPKNLDERKKLIASLKKKHGENNIFVKNGKIYKS